MVKSGSKIICFIERVGGIANLFQQLVSSSCQCRKIKAELKVNRLSCALLTANSSALCQVSLEFRERSPAYISGSLPNE